MSLCFKCGGYVHKDKCSIRLQEAIQTKKEIAYILNMKNKKKKG